MPESSRRDEYLLLSRGQWDPGKSSEEIQSAIDRFYIWYERLVAQGTFKRGHRLATGTMLVSRQGVTDGPFTEAKELIAGYTLIQVRSREEALEWSRRFPNPAGNGKEAVIELRQLIELDEFPPSDGIERFKQLDAERGA